MADISARITRKSLAAKRKAAVKTIKQQAKEKIREVQIEYNTNPERLKAKAQEKELRQQLRLQRANARLAYNSRHPREFSLGEDLFNSISHGIGAGLSVAAIVLLVVRAVSHAPEGNIPVSTYVSSFAVFGASLFVLYMFSTLYHAVTPYLARKIFSVLNHDAVYFLIGGTATPYLLTKAPGSPGLVAFIILWSLCAALIVLYSVFGAHMRAFSVFTYFVLGWVYILAFVFYPLGTTLPAVSEALLLAGGLAYTAGGVFFLMRKIKWTHSIFHLFVLAGSILHFFSVFYSV